MSATENLLKNAEQYADDFPYAGLATQPRLNVAIVACMDSRLKIFDIFNLAVGDAHIIRNAGGTVTDDVIRALTISQRRLGTREIILVHHTKCGMQLITDDGFRNELETETGVRPTWSVESFTDPAADVRQSIARIVASPFIPHRDAVRGFVYDVDTGKLTEVV